MRLGVVDMLTDKDLEWIQKIDPDIEAVGML
jgi:hypothetical protein